MDNDTIIGGLRVQKRNEDGSDPRGQLERAHGVSKASLTRMLTTERSRVPNVAFESDRFRQQSNHVRRGNGGPRQPSLSNAMAARKSVRNLPPAKPPNTSRAIVVADSPKPNSASQIIGNMIPASMKKIVPTTEGNNDRMNAITEEEDDDSDEEFSRYRAAERSTRKLATLDSERAGGTDSLKEDDDGALCRKLLWLWLLLLGLALLVGGFVLTIFLRGGGDRADGLTGKGKNLSPNDDSDHKPTFSPTKLRIRTEKSDDELEENDSLTQPQTEAPNGGSIQVFETGSKLPASSQQSNKRYSSNTARNEDIKQHVVLISGDVALQDSPQNKAMMWIMNEDTLQLETKSRNFVQRYALMAVYHSLNGPYWENNEGYGGDGHECTWHGVACSSSFEVTSLSLKNNTLTGTLPNELLEFTSLTSIDLSSNMLFGTIPEDISRLGVLEFLFLNNNHLHGTIPTRIVSVSTLKTLHLSENNLKGSIPESIHNLQGLENLWIVDNELTGEIPISIGSLRNLKKLELSGNSLSGTIPVTLSWLINLVTLNLSGNKLTGPLPEKLWSLTQLRELWLSYNSLEGELSTQIGGMVNLLVLGLDHNNLSGTLPWDIGRMEMLKLIMISGNDLYGGVPMSLCSIRFELFAADCKKVACSCCTICGDDIPEMERSGEKVPDV